MQQLQAEYGEDKLVALYYHVGDSYQTAETSARASLFNVSSIPEADFDAVTEVIGAGTSVITTYKPIVQARLAASTPVTMSTIGLVRAADDPDSSWVTATFRATDTVTYGTMRAQFVVYENIGTSFPWTVRDMLPIANITTLSAPGDSVVVTRKFKVNPGWNLPELHVAVFIEDPSPLQIINAQIMPDPYDNAFVETDMFASEIDYFGEAVYHTVLKNTGVMEDTLTLSLEHEILPDGLGPFDWAGFFCDTDGICHFGDWDYVLEPGQAETFDVHVVDGIGTTQGMALTSLSAQSKSDPLAASKVSFATFVELPSILLVDDDDGQNYQTYLQSAVEDTGYAVRVLDTSTEGRPTLGMLSSYWAVLWTTANGDASYLTVDDELSMAGYLEDGGNLMLASMGFLSSRAETSVFVSDYLHIDSWIDDNSGFTMTGVAGDEISDGMSLILLGGPFTVAGSDAIEASSPTDIIFTSPPGNKGIRVAEGDHKAVFMSFPFECVKTGTAAPSNAKTLIGRILNWFEETTGVVGGDEVRRLALGQNYPNPFNPVTKIAFSVPEDAGRVVLTVHNVAGQVVRTLVDGELPAGPTFVVWDGTDDSGKRLSSGVYFARLSDGKETALRKMTLLK